MEQKKRREISVMIYEILNDTRLNAECLDERELEHMTFLLTNKIVEKMEE